MSETKDPKAGTDQAQVPQLDLAQQIKKLTAERDAALTAVSEISGQLADQSKVTNGDIVVTIKKVKYILVGKKFIIPGKGEMTAIELSKDSETLASILKKGSEVLQKLTD